MCNIRFYQSIPLALFIILWSCWYKMGLFSQISELFRCYIYTFFRLLIIQAEEPFLAFLLCAQLPSKRHLSLGIVALSEKPLFTIGILPEVYSLSAVVKWVVAVAVDAHFPGSYLNLMTYVCSSSYSANTSLLLRTKKAALLSKTSDKIVSNKAIMVPRW